MSFQSELDRARAREDFPVLQAALEEYFGAFKSGRLPCEHHQPLIDRAGSDPTVGVAFAALASASCHDPGFLAFFAAGPLENLLRKPDRDTAIRLANEARKFCRFKWMLSGVWLHAVHNENRELIAAAVGDVSMDRDPMPDGPDQR